MSKLIAKRRDLGSHVANASFITDPAAAGRGVGKALGLHSLREQATATWDSSTPT